MFLQPQLKGFAFFDWICLFICLVIILTVYRFPSLIEAIRNHQKHQRWFEPVLQASKIQTFEEFLLEKQMQQQLEQERKQMRERATSASSAFNETDDNEVVVTPKRTRKRKIPVQIDESNKRRSPRKSKSPSRIHRSTR